MNEISDASSHLGLLFHFKLIHESFRVETSAAVEPQAREVEVPEIKSSHDPEVNAVALMPKERTFTSVSYTTTTTTITSYNVVTTTFYKTLSWGTAASVLMCLPSGFTLC